MKVQAEEMYDATKRVQELRCEFFGPPWRIGAVQRVRKGRKSVDMVGADVLHLHPRKGKGGVGRREEEGEMRRRESVWDVYIITRVLLLLIQSTVAPTIAPASDVETVVPLSEQ